MTIDDKIRDEKLQYGINREATKLSALLPAKMYKYEYFTSVKTLPSNQRQTIEQVIFGYSPLGKAFGKATTTFADHKKQLLNNELLLSKEREIFKNIYNERLETTVQ